MHGRVLKITTLVVIAACACCVFSVWTSSASSPSRRSLYWGASIGDQLTGTQAPWDMAAVRKFEQMAGKHLSIVHFASPFADCSSSPCSFYRFPTSVMTRVREHGAIPFLSWSSQSTPSSVDEPDFRLSDVISGRYDAYIRSFAEAAKNWGHPFFLRFDHEMNGNWFPWSEGVNENLAGEYVAAWRHVHMIFTSTGATNATWVWCPNASLTDTAAELAELYPGDAFVDWTCLDGYNFGTTTPATSWMSFDGIYRRSYRVVVGAVAPTKPMIIGEVASSEHGGSKAAWIRDMLRRLPIDYPRIHGVLWFDRYEGNFDWPIETSSTAIAAFARGISAPAFATNAYAKLATSPIPPPGLKVRRPSPRARRAGS